MRLHRALRSDWNKVPQEKRSIWQKLAAATGGIATPGNFVSVIGAALVLTGLWKLIKGSLTSGLVFVIIGRLADILDGLIADYTKTKSPLGEIIDASVDKILLLLSLIVLFDKHYLPDIVIIVMTLHGIYNIAVTTVARRLHIHIHPSRAGKLAATFEWLCIGLYLLRDVLLKHQAVISGGSAITLISFGLFVVFGTWSSYNYTRVVYYKRVMGNDEQ